MNGNKEIRNVGIVYFSGTGGTRRIAYGIEREMKGRGLEVSVRNLAVSIRENNESPEEQEIGKADLNILVYPVYAMDAPKPIYDWIQSVDSEAEGKRIAVISVSGGGEVWPNKGSRVNCIKILGQKGFEVVYDRMICMPANVLIEYNDHLAMHLINAIPRKVLQISDDLLQGKVIRTSFGKGALLSWLSKMQRENASKFSKRFQITDSCTSCGWCVRNCPMRNIEITEQAAKPQFLDRCVMCTRCLNGCPSQVIKSKGPLQLKHSLDLDALEKRMRGIELIPVEECCKGIVLKGVRDYLMDKY